LSLYFGYKNEPINKGGNLTSGKTKRQKEFVKFFERVKNSDFTAKDYFATHQTPISLPQYIGDRIRRTQVPSKIVQLIE